PPDRDGDTGTVVLRNPLVEGDLELVGRGERSSGGHTRVWNPPTRWGFGGPDKPSHPPLSAPPSASSTKRLTMGTDEAYGVYNRMVEHDRREEGGRWRRMRSRGCSRRWLTRPGATWSPDWRWPTRP